MSTEVIKVFDYIGEKLGIAIDWTQENLMPYLEDLVGRFIKLNIIEDIIGIICWALVFIGCVIGGIFILRDYNRVKEKKEECYSTYWEKSRNFSSLCTDVNTFGFASLIIGSMGLAASIIGLIFCISELIKWIYIPEFQIIEEISYILQTMGG